ncbi:dtw domain-containing protein 2-like protein [Lasius niger]|uniref:tRNA-uridine aminocarboxypropyltransferase n=1 Tax=Lasius niger TaxID=67767 RepID=A0A0J7L777_LASNI|nr:dtw domain-containing protein 2-like protein [Lasius niger]
MTNEDDVWNELASIPADPPETRDKCQQCKRPVQVCWCPGLPKQRLNPASRIIILQHPAEAKRCLRTVPMLALALESGKCLIFRGKKFPLPKHEGLSEILNDKNTILLYPSPGAIALDTLDPVGINEQKAYNLVLLDGTWPQAKAIYHSSPALYFLRACKLIGVPTSQFQLENGAVTHQSKEFLIKQKTYPKLIGKRLAKQLRILPDNTS